MAEQPFHPWVFSRRKRFIDFSAALISLIILAPLFLVVGLLVRYTSPGPIIFRQRRMGRNGLEFTIYKFRSMRIDAQEFGPITVGGDRRITPFGAVLRRYKLDELPQFFNVLRGDMSLVGPRPKLAHHEGLFMAFRPGITGAATIAFRFEEEMLKAIPPDKLDRAYEEWIKPYKARLDQEYMLNATFLSDMKLLLGTAKCALARSANSREVDSPIDFNPLEWQESE